jgi:drug/metabolite transporter (DMT)-like permease
MSPPLQRTGTVIRQAGGVRVAVFVIIGVIWGSNFLFVKVAVMTMSPEAYVLLRSVAAVLMLASLTAASGERLMPPRDRSALKDIILCGVTYNLVPVTALAIGEKYISSALASILTVTTPIWTTALTRLTIRDDRPTAVNYAGLILGLVGTALLVAPGLGDSNMTSRSQVGAILVVVAAVSTAFSFLIQQRRLSHFHPLQSALWQMEATVLLAIPGAYFMTDHFEASLAGMMAVLFVGFLAAGVALAAFFWLLREWGPRRASTVCYLLPITGMALGTTVLHEKLTSLMLLGLAVTIVGLLASTDTLDVGRWISPQR